MQKVLHINADKCTGCLQCEMACSYENYGVYAVQTLDALSIDLYGGARKFTYSDDLGTDYQDAYGVLAGARFFF